MRVADALEQYIAYSIRKGGYPQEVKTFKGVIDYMVFNAMKELNIRPVIERPGNLKEYIYNEVSKYRWRLKEDEDAAKRPSMGTFTVTSVAKQIGEAEGHPGIVPYVTRYATEVGGEYPYVWNGREFKLIHGNIGTIDKSYGRPSNAFNFVNRQGTALEFINLSRVPGQEEVKAEYSFSADTTADRQIWTDDTKTVYAYIANKVYRETSNPKGAAETDISIDLTSKMTDGSTPSNVTIGGKTFTRSWLSHRPMKILFVNKNIRVVLLAKFYYSYCTAYFDDDYFGPLGVYAKNTYELTIYDMLILDVKPVDESAPKIVSEHKVDHTAWNVIHTHSATVVGYLDVIRNSGTDDSIIVLKSDATPAFQSVVYSLYSYPETYDEDDPFIAMPTPNNTMTCKIPEVGYSLDEYIVDDKGLLTFTSNLYNHSGRLSLYKGNEVQAGVNNTMITQQPGSGEIYLIRFATAYKQGSYIPVRNKDSYAIYSLGFYEIIARDGTILFSGLTRSTGIYQTIYTWAERTSTPTKYVIEWLFVHNGNSRFVAEAIQFMAPAEYGLTDTLPEEPQNTESMRVIDNFAGSITGRPMNTATRAYKATGTDAVFAGTYAPVTASHLARDRFVALTDVLNLEGDKKFLWQVCKESIIASYQNEGDPVERTCYFQWGSYEHTPYFFKPDTDTVEMDVFYSIRNEERLRVINLSTEEFSSAEKIALYNRMRLTSQRSYGIFWDYQYDGSIETQVLADTTGWNNTSICQISDYDVFINVQHIQAEVIYDFSFTELVPEKINYTRRQYYLVCLSGTLGSFTVYTNDAVAACVLIGTETTMDKTILPQIDPPTP